MTIEELRLAFQNKTTIQKNALLSTFVGKSITIDASIIDIEPNEIKFEFISDFERMESMEYHCHIGYLRLKYNKEKFGEELLSYKDGDDVKIIATFLGISSRDIFDLDLTSIEKYNRTRQDRIYARQKKFHNSSCFIATACYGDINAPEVLILRQFRDSKLLINKVGRILVAIYYQLSPPFARLISKSERLKIYTRKILLGPIVSKIQKTN